MTTAREVWDAGLQPERTSLAWQRTALTLLGVGLLIPKLAWAVLDLWTLVPAGLVVAVAIFVLVAGHQRYRATHEVLTTGDGHLRDGRLPLLVAVTALVIAVLALGLLIASAIG
jgi:putative membrane protein